MKMDEIDMGGGGRSHRSDCARGIEEGRKNGARNQRCALHAAVIRLCNLGVTSAHPGSLRCRLLCLELSQLFPWPPFLQSGLLKDHLLRKAFPDHLILHFPHPTTPSPSQTPEPPRVSSPHPSPPGNSSFPLLTLLSPVAPLDVSS